MRREVGPLAHNAADPLSVLLGKLAVIATLAGIAAWLAVLVMLRVDGDAARTMPEVSLGIAIAASFAIGFPVALCAFQFAGRNMQAAPAILGLIAALAAIVLILASYWIGRSQAAYWLALPSLAALATYAGLGWLWIIRPRNGR